MITVTKIDAAHRQLCTAIRMFFDDSDAVAIHTLACAAREIYEKHCKALSINRMFEAIKSVNTGHTETQLWNILNKARNFFKHEGESLDETIEFDEGSNDYTLFIACHDCAMLSGGKQPVEVQAFTAWFFCVHEADMGGPQGDSAEAATEISAIIENKFPGLRSASRAEQKRRGHDIIREAQGILESEQLLGRPA